jgi:hypothetical protein
VAAGVDDHEVHPERPRRYQFLRQGADRTTAQLVVRRGQVYEVLRVGYHGQEADFPAAFGERLGVRTRHGIRPTLRVGDEDLGRLAPELPGDL